MENRFSNLYKTTTNIQNCSRFLEIFSIKYGISKHFPYFVEILIVVKLCVLDKNIKILRRICKNAVILLY